MPLIHRDCHNCAYKNIKPVPVVCNPCINEGFAVNWEGLLTPEGPAVDAEEEAFIRAMKRKKKKKRKGLGM